MNDQNKKQNPARQGVSMALIHSVGFALALIIASVLFYSAYKTNRSYSELRVAMDQTMLCLEDTMNLQAGSDFLMKEMQAFVVTGDRQHLDAYFEEAEVTSRREKALEELKTLLTGSQTLDYVERAMKDSEGLMELECSIIRLAAEGRRMDMETVPEAIRQVVLKDKDKDLAPEEKLLLAQQMAFGDEYQTFKADIDGNLALCSQVLNDEMKERHEQTAEQLRRSLWVQTVFVAVFFTVMLTFIVMNYCLMIRPLHIAQEQIQQHVEMPVHGASELRFFARTYNHIFTMNRLHQDRLSYEASHDGLTGTYNRAVFEKVKDDPEITQHCAMILIDVDDFKSINDRFGHDMGDKILQETAQLLMSSFRADDYVCRVGGDEFAVIIQNVHSDLKDLIRGKIEAIADRMQHPEDGLTPATLSVGVAFWDRENPTDDLYKDADVALYRVKDHNKNGCAFY